MQATPPSDASITPPQSSGYWESKDGFYVSLDGGAVFLNTPQKDNSNFLTDVETESNIATDGSLKSFKTDGTAGSIGGKLGYVFLRKPSESWLGENVRIEGSGSYFHSSASDSGMLTTPVFGATDYFAESLDGQYASFIGADGDTLQVTEKTNDYFHEGALAIKTDYFLGKDKEFTFTPSLGFDYSHLEQHFQTYLNSEEAFLNQAEKVGTAYYGLAFSFDLRANVSKNFVMFLDGSLTPELAYSNYSGEQDSTFGGTNYASDHAHEFTFTGSLTGGFSYDFGPAILTFSGGFRYWDYVATVKESEIPNGTAYFGPTTQPSHLVSDSMLNPQVTASVVVPF